MVFRSTTCLVKCSIYASVATAAATSNTIPPQRERGLGDTTGGGGGAATEAELELEGNSTSTSASPSGSVGVSQHKTSEAPVMAAALLLGTPAVQTYSTQETTTAAVTPERPLIIRLVHRKRARKYNLMKQRLLADASPSDATPRLGKDTPVARLLVTAVAVMVGVPSSAGSMVNSTLTDAAVMPCGNRHNGTQEMIYRHKQNHSKRHKDTSM
eukprot:SAG11_NODE_111_length_16190_cov_9.912808_10_plen_213_part_00